MSIYTPFSGVISDSPLRVSIGTCFQNSGIIAKAGEPEDLANKVEFLPLLL